MFKRKKRIVEDKPEIDYAIDDLVAKMRLEDPASEDYQKMAASLETICRAKNFKDSNEAEKGKRKVDPNVVIAAVAGVAQIVIVVAYEHGHVLCSKALNFVLHNRI